MFETTRAESVDHVVAVSAMQCLRQLLRVPGEARRAHPVVRATAGAARALPVPPGAGAVGALPGQAPLRRRIVTESSPLQILTKDYKDQM